MADKMKWTRPQLIVLTRGTPEESVLDHCKAIASHITTHQYYTSQYGCSFLEANNNCSNCKDRGGGAS